MWSDITTYTLLIGEINFQYDRCEIDSRFMQIREITDSSHFGEFSIFVTSGIFQTGAVLYMLVMPV